MYKHILIAYDGSALSDKAVAEGIRFAKQTGSRASLLYVLTPLHLPAGGAQLSPVVKELERQHAEVLRQHASEMLERAHGRFAEAGVPCEIVLVEGYDPYDHIVQEVSRRNCDLIVMASHGRRGIEAVTVGSQTTKVINHTKVPVLVVR